MQDQPGSSCSGFIPSVSVFLVPGSPYYDNVRPLSYPDSDAVLICFDISRPETLDSVLKKVCSRPVVGSRGEHGASEGLSQNCSSLVEPPLTTAWLHLSGSEVCSRGVGGGGCVASVTSGLVKLGKLGSGWNQSGLEETGGI